MSTFTTLEDMGKALRLAERKLAIALAFAEAYTDCCICPCEDECNSDSRNRNCGELLKAYIERKAAE